MLDFSVTKTRLVKVIILTNKATVTIMFLTKCIRTVRWCGIGFQFMAS